MLDCNIPQEKGQIVFLVWRGWDPAPEARRGCAEPPQPALRCGNSLIRLSFGDEGMLQHHAQ